ncbi:MAG: DegT/DnrJ/EryC1/StrS family aminotransferase [Candidatus Wildermuthbacteria bacterium]|nr:DegT/DnrJ/EryC1/StrS family aminotransferase [Candidatus Wildermuthbacteria bacterium]
MRIPFGTISITPKAKELVNEALDSGRVSNGKYVKEFEQGFAKIVGVKEVVAVSSGTDADTIALAVLHDFGAKRGDEIIVPALSFVSTGNAVLHAGFIPVFVDVKRETYNIDPTKIEEAITEKTKAIMPVHLMGKPADMDAICQIAKQHGLYVIEDAAEAHGAIYKGKNVGSIGDMGAFSTYVAHLVSSVEGGMITTDNSDFADIARALRNHGKFCHCQVCSSNAKFGHCPDRFLFSRIGYSAKMNDLEAAVGVGSLEIYEKVLAIRRKNLLSFMKKFEAFKPYLTTFREEAHEQIGPHAFPFVVAEGAPFTRGELYEYIEEKEIDARQLFSSMPTQCKGFEFLGHKAGEFPNAEFIGNNGLHIGVHQDITEEHIEYFMQTIKEFLETHIK